MSVEAPEIGPDWARLIRLTFAAGMAGLGACALGALFDRQHFFRSYLIAFHCWLGIPLGCLAILMLHNLTGGRWGLAIRPVLETAAKTLPLFVLLFLPVVLGLGDIYIWTDSALVDNDELLQHKSAYLNVPFFLMRTVFYFAVWIGLAVFLKRWSGPEQQDAESAQRLQLVSGLGLVLYSLTVTFAAIDWLMSLEPHWSSTIFGVLIAASQLLPGLAFAIVILAWSGSRQPVAGVIVADIWNDLGNLLLAFVMIWAYMSFSQFLLIWSGNLREEITWYVSRSQHGWEWLAWSLVIFYFFLPFFLLLSRDMKRNPRRLLRIAAAVLVMHVVFQFWLIAPAFAGHEQGSETARSDAFPWMAPVAIIGVGGFWLATFFSFFQTVTLPVQALEQSVEADHG